jgi:hypothetical protein
MACKKLIIIDLSGMSADMSGWITGAAAAAAAAAGLGAAATGLGSGVATAGNGAGLGMPGCIIAGGTYSGGGTLP